MTLDEEGFGELCSLWSSFLIRSPICAKTLQQRIQYCNLLLSLSTPSIKLLADVPNG